MPADCLEEFCNTSEWVPDVVSYEMNGRTAHYQSSADWYRHDLRGYKLAFKVSRNPVAEQFQKLSEQWKDETQLISSETDLVLHPAYQRIIGLGMPVVPYLLRDLEQSGSRWFWALRNILGVNPVSFADRGKHRKMVEAWVAWGREHHYL